MSAWGRFGGGAWAAIASTPAAAGVAFRKSRRRIVRSIRGWYTAWATRDASSVGRAAIELLYYYKRLSGRTTERLKFESPPGLCRGRLRQGRATSPWVRSAHA